MLFEAACREVILLKKLMWGLAGLVAVAVLAVILSPYDGRGSRRDFCEMAVYLIAKRAGADPVKFRLVGECEEISRGRYSMEVRGRYSTPITRDPHLAFHALVAQHAGKDRYELCWYEAAGGVRQRIARAEFCF
ncbi:hypothetical protein [Oceanibaculum indicum]|uniref:Uncharacterized protein n=1 Tax=Oceanibaculum indicum P24 TaxID=1207063 RepID=K2JJY7_9PROT|nr:hypothetical protein [Oceanibaculum indicum]EKE70874.1 hypothetical protein P24_15064 [Oceanibaculum indicum P24]